MSYISILTESVGDVGIMWGLINRILPREEIDNASIAMAKGFAQGPTRALGEIRKGCWHALEVGFAEQLARDRIVQRPVGQTADHREAMAAFFDKRIAVFAGN
jgi:2-(1,2-epoxy-1,2-dihydrophenyl)acetyl-CoA isomerase